MQRLAKFARDRRAMVIDIRKQPEADREDEHKKRTGDTDGQPRECAQERAQRGARR